MNPLQFLPLDIENIILDYVNQLEEHDKEEKVKCRIRYCIVMNELKQYFTNKHIQKEREWIECWRRHLGEKPSWLKRIT